MAFEASNHADILHFKRRDVVVHILETVDRNQTFQCSFAHFLIPYALTLLTVFVKNGDSESFLMTIFFIVLKKLTNPEISSQIKG